MQAKPLTQSRRWMTACISNPRLRQKTIRTWDAPTLLRLWHLTSLDAPTVAVVWALGFGWAAGGRLPLWVPVLLALGAWTVYVVDRLLDAGRSLKAGRMDRLRERHRFHWRHRFFFAPLAVAAAGVTGWIVLSLMPIGARERDAVLAAAATVYFARVHSGTGGRLRHRATRVFTSKEFWVGVLFTAGCVLPSLNRASAGDTRLWTLGAAVFFVFLAWLNCHAIDHWESGIGTAKIRRYAIVLAAAGLLLAATAAASENSQPRTAALLVAGMASAVLLGALDRLRSRLTPMAVRVLADLVLLTPLGLLWR